MESWPVGADSDLDQIGWISQISEIKTDPELVLKNPKNKKL